MTGKLATVVILTYNARGMASEAAQSVLDQTIADRLRVVVVDNGSSDGTADHLARRFGRRIVVVRCRENLGFAGGNNLGFRYAEGKYLLLLNNDAVAEPNWAEELIRVAETDASVGMCTSKILTYRDRGLVDCAGHNLSADGIGRSRGNWQRDDGRFDVLEETLVASGCAALYRREAVSACGGFDEDFFAYVDDIELGLTLRLMGCRCMYVPTAVVYHHGSASESRAPYGKVFLIERNRIWVLIKFFPWHWVVLSPWHTFCRLHRSWQAGRRGLGRAGLVARQHSSWRLGITILKAWIAALRGAPRMHRKRLAIMARRRIPTGRFWATLRRFRASQQEMAFS